MMLLRAILIKGIGQLFSVKYTEITEAGVLIKNLHIMSDDRLLMKFGTFKVGKHCLAVIIFYCFAQNLLPNCRKYSL